MIRKFLRIFILCFFFACCDNLEFDEQPSVDSLRHPPRSRVSRAANDDGLSRVIEKMQIVARLVTGIALNEDLRGENKPTVHIITEFLRLGNATPAAITSINGSRLQTALSRLKELKTKLLDVGDESWIGEALKKQNQMRTIVAEETEWNKRDEFWAEMGGIAGSGVNLTLVEEATGLMEGWKPDMDRLLKPNEPNYHKVKIGELTTSSKKLLDLANGLTNSMTPFLSVESALWSVTPISSLIKKAKMVVYYEKFLKTKSMTSAFTAHDNNSKVLVNVSSGLGDVVADLGFIHSLTQSRESPFRGTRRYPGFPNGWQDMETIPTDLGNEWLAKVLNTQQLGLGLEQLTTVLAEFKNSDNLLGDSSYGSPRKMSSLLQVIDDIRNDSPILDKFWKFNGLFSSLDQLNATAVDSFMRLVADMRTKIDVLGTEYTAFLNTWATTSFIGMLTKVNGSLVTGDDNVLRTTIANLNSSQEVKDLMKVMEDAKKSFGSVSKVANDIQSVAKTILGSRDVVDSYMNYQPKLETVFKSLGQDQSDGVKTATKRMARLKASTAADEGEGVVQRVVNFTTNFEKLRKGVEMRTVVTTASFELESFPSPLSHATTIGMAVEGATSMLMALEKKPHAELLMQNAPVVEVEMKRLPGDEDQLKAVVGLGKSMGHMYQKLEDWKTLATDQDSIKFEDYCMLFINAKAVPGFVGELGEMGRAVGRLAARVNDTKAEGELLAVQKAIDLFDEIGLDFARYTSSFDHAEESLAAVSKFFSTFRKEKPKNIPQQRRKTSDPDCCLLDSEQSFFDKYLALPWWMIVVLLVLVAMIAAVFVFIFWKLRRDERLAKEKRRERRRKRKEATAAASGTPTATPVTSDLPKSTASNLPTPSTSSTSELR